MIVPYTNGFAVLPEEGGYLDQSNYLMALFDAFMVGERNAFYLAK